MATGLVTSCHRPLFAVISSRPPLVNQEECVAKSPYDVSAWAQYLDLVDELIAEQGDSSSKVHLLQIRDLVGRRAVHLLPKSYKLWKNHWEFCLQHNVGDIVQMWEKALVTLNKFPRVWIEYLEYAHTVATTSGKMSPTKLRHLANRALEALPVTQHDKIWPVLLEYYQSEDHTFIPKETKLSMLRRYVQFNPLATKDVADFLANKLEHWGEAALLYVQLLNESGTPAPMRKDLWMSLAEIAMRHPLDEVGIDWDALVRGVLKNPGFLSDELEGVVWNQLATSWIRRGEFQLARSVYEEAIESVSKVRDFTILLDAYLQFEEGLLEATMEAAEGEDEAEEVVQDTDDWDLLLASNQSNENSSALTSASKMADLELAMARAEDLTSRRPILLNRVLLRQNPHDVGEWLKRARLYQEKVQFAQAAAALEEGLRTVFARRAVGGSPYQMVTKLVEIYETDMNDVAKSRDLLDRICNRWEYEFKHADDLAECFAAWVELELRQESWDEALTIIRGSTVVPPGTKDNPTPKMVKGLSKSLRLWDLLLDLEESLGTVQSAKDSYDRAIEQRVATPLHILNYASFLADNKYFEESFAAYERGIELFPFPGVKAIWTTYLQNFLKRYEGTKIERTRDLFQRCLESCPAEDCVEFFLLNGKFEEDFGLTKRALTVYRHMCDKVPAEEKYTAYKLFIAKTTKYQGQTATRDIYQSAIQDLPDGPAAKLCIDFANMETSLSELDRARAVWVYGAQMADPRRNDEYWNKWNEFEVAHGNEETFRDMLRIKRSVEASFSTVNYNAAEMSQTSAKVETLTDEQAMRMIAEQEGVELDLPVAKPATAVAGFVSAKRSADAARLDGLEERAVKLRKATEESTAPASTEGVATNEDEDEIDLDDLDDVEGDEDDAVQNVSTKPVPAAVFGGLAKLASDKK
eukprot:Nitzschia sp. Nitz4//scaffold196_size54656//45242//48010//NITZ4_006647-RA/size54656-processed-gene-0.55-mRNA-1//1//CDS//3329540450//309//frame0